MVLLNCAPAFCATEKTEEKKPLVELGEVSVPPGVLVSSSVGVKGELREVDSLLGKFADCARLCRMLSTEFRLRAAGEVKVSANVGKSACVLVTGVGGVTSVVGGSWRFCGVDGRTVLIGRDFGIDADLSLLLVSPLCGSKAESCSLEASVFTLFLLLEVLKMPPRPTPPPPPRALAGSVSPPDLFRGSVQALRSLLGDGLRSGSELEELLFAFGSTMTR